MKWNVLDKDGNFLGCITGESLDLETAKTVYPEAASLEENTQSEHHGKE